VPTRSRLLVNTPLPRPTSLQFTLISIKKRLFVVVVDEAPIDLSTDRGVRLVQLTILLADNTAPELAARKVG
jgi:hypothetical protein